MPRRRSSTSPDQLEFVFLASDPLDRLVVCDQDTLDVKAAKHGERFVSVDTARDLIEHPEVIYKSQHVAADKTSVYYKPYERARHSKVKYLKGAVDFSDGVGRVLSIHPKGKIGAVGPKEWPLDEAETTNADG